MEQTIIIKEDDYNSDIIAWERTVDIIKWEHDYISKCYIITYKTK